VKKFLSTKGKTGAKMVNEYYWLVQALGYWSVAFLIIPLQNMKKLLYFGLLGGFLYTITVQLMAIWVFHKWRFTQDVFSIWGIPFFFIISWFGVTMIYGFFLLKYPRYQYLLVFAFAVIGTALNFFGKYFQMITMTRWNLLDTLMFAVFSHVLILYLFKLLFHQEELGAG
jgi:hypothetical protein